MVAKCMKFVYLSCFIDNIVSFFEQFILEKNYNIHKKNVKKYKIHSKKIEKYFCLHVKTIVARNKYFIFLFLATTVRGAEQHIFMCCSQTNDKPHFVAFAPLLSAKLPSGKARLLQMPLCGCQKQVLAYFTWRKIFCAENFVNRYVKNSLFV